MANIPIEHENQLVEFLEAGSKPAEKWRIGTEYEKFGFRLDDLSPLCYDGRPGIAAIFRALSDTFDWKPVEEQGKIIALLGDKRAISLEPGGQLELAGAALTNLHQTHAEVDTHLKQLKSVAEPMGAAFLGMGFTPLWRRADMSWMPKERYRIMRKHMPHVGALGIDMMQRTATIQVSLDFQDEGDMVRKFRLSLALQPIVTALFANSPFSEGKPNGYLSYRSHIWEDTDPARCGMLPFVFEPGMGFERYVQYALDIPMYFVDRAGKLIDTTGQSFRHFLAGRLPALPGELPTLADWKLHLTTAFPEVRLKQVLEMRGADAGSGKDVCALPALWVGLLYDKECLDAAWNLVRHWTVEERQQLRIDAPRIGLKAKTPSGTLRELAKEVLAIAESGLQKRALLNRSGDAENIYLGNLWETVRSGKTPAERKLARFHGDWHNSVRPIFSEFAW